MPHTEDGDDRPGWSRPWLRSRVAWAWTGLVALAAVLTPLAPGGPPSRVEDAVWLGVGVFLTALGAVLVAKAPGNRIGLLLIVSGSAMIPDELARVLTWTTPEAATLPVFAAVIASNVAWAVIFLSLFHVLIVFPTGHLPSPRWRWVLLVEAGLLLFLVTLTLFSPELAPNDDRWRLANPIGLEALRFEFEGPVAVAFASALFSVVLAGPVALVIRWRAASPVVREQIKWVVFGGLVFLAGYTLQFWTSTWDDTDGIVAIIFLASFLILPVSMTVAIARFRLFEIDRIMSRSISYALVIGALALVYVGTLGVVSSLVPVESDVAIAASTLSAVMVFNPVRRRVQRLIDRRFNRTRYVAEEEFSAFARRLRTITAVEGTVADLASLIGRVLDPVSIDVWLAATDQTEAAVSITTPSRLAPVMTIGS